MLPMPPYRAFTELPLISCRPLLPGILESAGNFDGCFRPEGRAFSSCDAGRSMFELPVFAIALMIQSCLTR